MCGLLLASQMNGKKDLFDAWIVIQTRSMSMAIKCAMLLCQTTWLMRRDSICKKKTHKRKKKNYRRHSVFCICPFFSPLNSLTISSFFFLFFLQWKESFKGFLFSFSLAYPYCHRPNFIVKQTMVNTLVSRVIAVNKRIRISILFHVKREREGLQPYDCMFLWLFVL